MKNSMIALAALTLITAVSSSSFALVFVAINCKTADNNYTIRVIDNEGIGPVRTPSLVGSVTDMNGNVVASYPVTKTTGPMSASFGRIQYAGSAFGKS